ncbi:MAG: inositol monophosphatase family protein [Gammaproteobacteria bacterium]|nr:inositol monophosphatase [Pseudomonadales bacterium]MCP5346463.1 inositol monophosphatase [Pseudomonadales bacterium]
MQALLNIALRAIRDGATALTGNFDRLDRVRLVEERDDGPLTSAHLDVETAMLMQLQKTFPKHGFQSSASRLPEPDEAGTIWFLEPLIGSANFLRGAHGFLLGLTCRVDNQIKLSVFADPLLNEEFTAVRGSGASLNGHRIRVAGHAELQDSTLAMDFTSELDREHLLHNLGQFLEQGATIRSSGNSVLDLVNVAAGRLDAGIVHKPSAIALAGAAMLLREAGGLISDAMGNPQLESNQLVFANPRLFRHLLRLARSQA